jgi:malate dehydrogenase (oxaloacetate-decarboxylating)(NADP+)
MLLGMAPNPIVFAMANPVPEIDYNLAIETRKDIIMATGRSDHPNQVNNVLGFLIFFVVRSMFATKINEAMKMAAVKALAALAKESVPEQVNIAYGETKLIFGREYIIPKPFDRDSSPWLRLLWQGLLWSRAWRCIPSAIGKNTRRSSWNGWF